MGSHQLKVVLVFILPGCKLREHQSQMSFRSLVNPARRNYRPKTSGHSVTPRELKCPSTDVKQEPLCGTTIHLPKRRSHILPCGCRHCKAPLVGVADRFNACVHKAAQCTALSSLTTSTWPTLFEETNTQCVDDHQTTGNFSNNKCEMCLSAVYRCCRLRNVECGVC